MEFFSFTIHFIKPTKRSVRWSMSIRLHIITIKFIITEIKIIDEIKAVQGTNKKKKQ